MPGITILFGALLCSLPLVTLVLESMQFKSLTIFIPMVIGLPLIVFGAMASIAPHLRKHAMHGAVLFGLVGALAALGRGIPQLIKLARGAEVDTLPMVMVWTMAILCTIYVVLCVRSFIQARRNRTASK